MVKFKVAGIQMPTSKNKEKNLQIASNYIEKVAQEGADVAVLGEMFNTPYNPENFPKYAEHEGEMSWKALSKMARDNNIYLIAGSIPEFDDKKKYIQYFFCF